MKTELPRQLVHISGLLFIILAQFIGGLLTAFYFFVIAGTILLYSEYMKREQNRWLGIIDRFESKLRELAIKLERKEIERPFLCAFWFYAGCGLAFLIFPLNIASAACAMLAIGDASSTLVGMRFGKHRIMKNKTLEGSSAFFLTAFFISLIFINPLLALLGSIVAMLTELIPGLSIFKKLRKKHLIDDNFLIPIIAGAVMFLVGFLF